MHSNSCGAQEIRRQLASVDYRQGPIPNKKKRAWSRGASTFGALINTLYDLSNGTQAQVGAFEWRAEVQGKKVHIFIRNKVDFNSFFFHIPDFIGIPPNWEVGPMSTIIQTFDWWEDVPTKYQK